MWVAVRIAQVGAAWDRFCVNFKTVEVFRGASEPSQTAERIVYTKLDPSVSYANPRLSEERSLAKLSHV